jgi:NIMA (never in mitosis gene a)-related kinase
MLQQRVMHRDLKPANIFMDESFNLKLGDLGLGRDFSSQTMEAFSRVGTPLYMSPEVL